MGKQYRKDRKNELVGEINMWHKESEFTKRSEKAGYNVCVGHDKAINWSPHTNNSLCALREWIWGVQDLFKARSPQCSHCSNGNQSSWPLWLSSPCL